MIQVGYNRDAGRASPGGGDAGGCGIVPVHVQESSGSDPSSLEKGRRDSEARVAAPNNGALPGTCINQDEGHLAERSRNLGEIAMDSGAAEFAAMQVGGVVVPDDSNIMSAESPALAGDEGGCDLASRHDLGTEHFQLGTQSRELGELQNGVGGVFADAQDVKTLSAHEVVVQGIGRAEKCKVGLRRSVRPIILNEPRRWLTESGGAVLAHRFLKLPHIKCLRWCVSVALS